MGRKITILGFAFLFAVSLTFLAGGSVSAQTVAGSKHDFSTTGTVNVDLGFSSPCFACHVPHPKGGVASTYDFLWNRPDLAATPAWTMYDTANLTLANQGQSVPTGQDRLCLSCHDGTLTISSSGDGTAGVGVITTVTPTQTDTTFSAAELSVGRDLSNDHPVGISYTITLAGPKAAEFNAVPTAAKLFPDAGGDDRVRCASCHNPHDDGGTTGKFLRTTPALICQNCHIK